MAVSHLRGLILLILAVTFVTVTPKLHLQVSQEVRVVSPPKNFQQFDRLPIQSTRKKALLKDDASEKFSSQGQQNITFLVYDLNSASLVTDKYVILVQDGELSRNILWKLDLQTITLEQISFGFLKQQESLRQYWYFGSKLMALGNGDIALSHYENLYILNNETFQIKQTLKGHDRYDYIEQLYSYRDFDTKQTKYLVGRLPASMLTSQLIRLPSGQYVVKEKIMLGWEPLADGKTTNSVFLTGQNSAVYLENCAIKYINTLDSIVNISYDPSNFFEKRTKIAVSYDESIFVLRSEAGFFEFYKIGGNLSISLIRSVFVSKDFSFIKKGATTTDDAFVFTTMANQKNKSDVVKIDPSTGNCTFVAGQQIDNKSILDFNLFNADYNRIVTLEQRESNKYFLQLRTVNNLSIITEYPLEFDFPIIEAKLVGSPLWDLRFAVALRIYPSSYYQVNDTKLFLYEIKGDQIVSLNKQRNASFDVIQACHKYIVNYKQKKTTLRIFSYYDLALTEEIETGEISIRSIQIQKNILMILDKRTIIYDFEKSFEKVGQLYTSNDLLNNKCYSIILSQRGLLYQAPTSIRDSYQPATKIFFNISYLPFQKIVQIQPPTYLQSCNFALYYSSPTQNCDFVFFIGCLDRQSPYCTKPGYVKYKDCSNEREEYPIEGFSEKIADQMLFISTDRKYIVSILKTFRSKEILLDIRPIDNLSIVYFHKIFEYYESGYTYLHQFYVDIIKDNLILIRSPEFVTTYFIKPKENTS